MVMAKLDFNLEKNIPIPTHGNTKDLLQDAIRITKDENEIGKL